MNRPKPIFRFIYELFMFFVWVIPLMFFSLLTISYLMFLLFPDVKISYLSEGLIFLSNDIFINFVILNVILVIIGMFFSLKDKSFKFKSIFSTSKDIRITAFISSFFLSYYLAYSFKILVIFKNICFIFLFIILTLLLPSMIKFLTINRFKKVILLIPDDNLKNFKNDCCTIGYKGNFKKFIFKHKKSILYLFIILILIGTSMLLIARSFYKHIGYQASLRNKFIITEIVPNEAIVAQKIEVRGYNFGFKEFLGDKLMSPFGPVVVDEWTGEKLIFIIPLHWKEGKAYLWVEKQSANSKKIKKSNKKEMLILSRWNFYPTLEEVNSKNGFLIKVYKRIKRELFFLQ